MVGKPTLVGLYVRVPFDEVPQNSWTPADPSDVDVGLVIDVGWEGEQGTTLFYARVATPHALQHAKPRPDTDRILSTRSLIVMSSYDRAELEREVQATLSWAGRKQTQEEVFSYLTRFYGWEYEDYEIADSK